ncbi:MAG: hypothetical protein GY713_17700 [Actinomycetia bacterium]|nr:hypothetical protein [Actinomycetes bacterium]
MTIDGADALLSFGGERGTSEHLRYAAGGWIATTTGLDTYRVSGGAASLFELRVRGANFDQPYSTVSCVLDGDPPPPPPPPMELACEVTTVGPDAIITIMGDQGSSTQLRYAGVAGSPQ